jgi:hypothetical protein
MSAKDLQIAIDGLLPEEVKISLKSELMVSEDLERDVRRTAAQYGYYAVLAEKAESRHRRGKLAFDMWRSEYEDELSQNTKFARVKDLTRQVMKHPKYKAWMLKLDKYQEDAGLMRAITKAFEHKKDLVQTSAADRRREMR